jgi:hypothetical protein
MPACFDNIYWKRKWEIKISSSINYVKGVPSFSDLIDFNISPLIMLFPELNCEIQKLLLKKKYTVIPFGITPALQISRDICRYYLTEIFSISIKR